MCVVGVRTSRRSRDVQVPHRSNSYRIFEKTGLHSQDEPCNQAGTTWPLRQMGPGTHIATNCATCTGHNMKTFLSAMVAAAGLSLTALPIWAGTPLPEPSHSRIIVHGVDCSIELATVCNEDRALFDEAIDSMPQGAAMVIQDHELDAADGQSTQPLSCESAQAVRDYFVGAGVAPQQIGIEECSASDAVDSDEPIALQLSTAFK